MEDIVRIHAELVEHTVNRTLEAKGLLGRKQDEPLMDLCSRYVAVAVAEYPHSVPMVRLLARHCEDEWMSNMLSRAAGRLMVQEPLPTSDEAYEVCLLLWWLTRYLPRPAPQIEEIKLTLEV
jgi:hypothetical protein